VKVLKISTHKLAAALRSGRDAPIRCFAIGRFVIAWDGKPGDVPEVVSVEEMFQQGDPT
jgi:hypothetical protein